MATPKSLVDRRGGSTKHWRESDLRHFLHPFTDYAQLERTGSRIITRAEGVYLWDSEGNRILDAMAGLWCVNVGYGRPELARAATRQLEELPYYNSFFQTSHPRAIELAELLAEITPPGLDRVFFTNSGSEANDTVIRMVRRYWDLLGEPQRKVIVSREHAYHGSTVGAASLAGMTAIREQGDLPIPDIVHIEAPYGFKNAGDRALADYGLDAARALERKIEELGASRVAAFIGEPIQGAGGVIIPPASYWPEIQRICRKYGVLLVVDEVICGFGRLGEWFGSDHYGLEPDLMPIAKGLSSGYLPIGGVMVRDEIARTLIERGGEFQHGFTYSGHPVACAVAIANLGILRDEKIIDRVKRDTGPYFAARWAELGEHPLVGEARSTGFLGALELVRDRATGTPFESDTKVGIRCRDLCIQNGLVMRAIGDTMVVSPPLVMTRAEIDDLVYLARQGLDQIAADVGVA